MTGLVPLLAVMMAVGTVGTIVPLVPGISLVWAAGLVYGLDRGFGAVGVVAFAVITSLALSGIVAGYRAGSLGISMVPFITEWPSGRRLEAGTVRLRPVSALGERSGCGGANRGLDASPIQLMLLRLGWRFSD